MARTVVTTTQKIKLDTTEPCPHCGGEIPIQYEGNIISRTSGKTFLGIGTDAIKERARIEADAEFKAAVTPIFEGILARTPCPKCGKLHPTGERRKAELAAQAKKNQRNLVLVVIGIIALMVWSNFFSPDAKREAARKAAASQPAAAAPAR